MLENFFVWGCVLDFVAFFWVGVISEKKRDLRLMFKIFLTLTP
jgi:hypothetical protein